MRALSLPQSIFGEVAQDIERSVFAILQTLLSWLLVALSVAIFSPVHAQSLPGLGGGGASGMQQVDREKVRETALESFKEYVERRNELTGGEVDNSESDVKSSAAAAEDVIQRYESALDNKLNKLESDGLLSATEVKEELSALRSTYEQQHRTVMTAVRQGYPPPPLRSPGKSFGTFWKEMSRYTALVRNSPIDWLIVLGWLLAGGVAAWGINLGAYRTGEKVSTDGLPSIGSVLRSLAGPLYVAALAIGLHFGLEQIWLPAVLESFLGNTVSVLLTGALFWFFWNASPGIATAILRTVGSSYSTEFDNHAHNILLRCIRILIIVGVTMVIVRSILDTNLGSMLTGLGVLGIALYFILRGTIENIAASFTLFSDQPFRVGDVVMLKDEWGTIEDIGFRSTEFRQFNGFLVTVPNRELIYMAIVNVSARPTIRRRFRIGLTYQTSPDKIQEAMDIVRDIISDGTCSGADDDETYAPRVEFEQFGEYDLQLLVQYHFEPPDYWQAMARDTKINFAILERLNEAEIDIAFPTETHIIEGSDGEPPVSVAVEDAGESVEDSAGNDDDATNNSNERSGESRADNPPDRSRRRDADDRDARGDDAAGDTAEAES